MKALLEEAPDPLFAHALAPARHRGTVEGQFMAEGLLPAEILKIRVLDPACAQLFVGEVEGVLEDRQSRHQPGRQGRHAGAVTINRAASLLDEAPRDRVRELHQLVLRVDDLVEPGAEQILLARLPALPWLVKSYTCWEFGGVHPLHG